MQFPIFFSSCWDAKQQKALYTTKKKGNLCLKVSLFPFWHSAYFSAIFFERRRISIWISFALTSIALNVVKLLVLELTLISISSASGRLPHIYYKILFGALELIWHDIPNKFIVDVWPEWTYVMWIPIVGFSMAFCSGLTVKYMG